MVSFKKIYSNIAPDILSKNAYTPTTPKSTGASGKYNTYGASSSAAKSTAAKSTTSSSSSTSSTGGTKTYTYTTPSGQTVKTTSPTAQVATTSGMQSISRVGTSTGGGSSTPSTPTAKYTYTTPSGQTVSTTSGTTQVLTSEGMRPISQVGTLSTTSNIGARLPSGGYIGAGVTVREGGAGPGGSLLYPVSTVSRTSGTSSKGAATETTAAAKIGEKLTTTTTVAAVTPNLLATPASFTVPTLTPTMIPSAVSTQPGATIKDVFAGKISLQQYTSPQSIQTSYLPPEVTPKSIMGGATSIRGATITNILRKELPKFTIPAAITKTLIPPTKAPPTKIFPPLPEIKLPTFPGFPPGYIPPGLKEMPLPSQLIKTTTSIKPTLKDVFAGKISLQEYTQPISKAPTLQKPTIIKTEIKLPTISELKILPSDITKIKAGQVIQMKTYETPEQLQAGLTAHQKALDIREMYVGENLHPSGLLGEKYYAPSEAKVFVKGMATAAGDIWGAVKEPIISTIPGLSQTRYEGSLKVGEKAPEIEKRVAELGIIKKGASQDIFANMPPVVAARYIGNIGKSIQLKQDIRELNLQTKRETLKDLAMVKKDAAQYQGQINKFESILSQYPEGYKDPFGKLLSDTEGNPIIATKELDKSLLNAGYTKTNVVPEELLPGLQENAKLLQESRDKINTQIEQYVKTAPTKTQTMKEYQISKMAKGEMTPGQFLWGDVGTGVASTAIDVAALEVTGVLPGVFRGLGKLPTALSIYGPEIAKGVTVGKTVGTALQVLPVVGGLGLFGAGAYGQAQTTGAQFEKFGLPKSAGIIEGLTKSTAELATGIFVGTKGEASPLKLRTVEFGGVTEPTTGISTGGAKYYTMSWEGIKGATPLVTYAPGEARSFLGPGMYPKFSGVPGAAITDTTKLIMPSSKTEFAFYKEMLKQAPIQDQQIVLKSLTQLMDLKNVKVPGKPEINVRKVEGVEGLSPEQQNALVLKLKEWGKEGVGFNGVVNAVTNQGTERVYGSAGIKAQQGITRQAGDIDWSFLDKALPRAEEMSKYLNKFTGPKVRTVEGAVESYQPSKGGWNKVLDLHGSDTPELMVPGTKFGVKDLGVQIGQIEGQPIPLQNLAQSAFDKLSGFAGLTKDQAGKVIMTGLPKRGMGLKDAQDLPAIMQRLVQIKTGGAETTTPAIESIKSLLSDKYPGIKFTNPTDVVFQASGGSSVSTGIKTAISGASLGGLGTTRYQLTGFKSPVSTTLPEMPSMTTKLSNILGYSGPSVNVKQIKAETKQPTSSFSAKISNTLSGNIPGLGTTPTSEFFSPFDVSKAISFGIGTRSKSIVSEMPSLSILKSLSPYSFSPSIVSPSPSKISEVPSPSPPSPPPPPSPSPSSYYSYYSTLISPSLSPSSAASMGGWKMPTFGGLGGGLSQGERAAKLGKGAYSWLVTNPIAPYAEEWLARQKTKTLGGLTGVTGTGFMKELGLKSNTLRGKI